MRELASFIMRGRIYAIAVAGLFGIISLFFMPMAFLSGAAVGLVSLRKGSYDGLLVAGSAFLLTFAVFLLIGERPGFPFPLVTALWLPVLVCTEVLRRFESQGVMLATIGALAALFVIGMHVLTGDVVQWWREWLRVAVANVQGATVEGFARDNTLRLFNGMVAMIFGISMMLTMLLARWWQALLYHPGGFAEEFHNLRIPRLILPAVVAIVLLAGSINKIAMADLFMVGLMVYFFQGIAVMHGIVAKRNLAWVWLLPPYFLLFFLPQYVIAGLALLGAVDSLIDFRAAQRAK